jgi:hypothetical protein
MQAGVWKCMPQYIWWICEVVYGESKLSLGYGREIALVKMYAFIFVND